MSIATRITNAFARLTSWAVIKCTARHPDPRALLVDAAYKELERKAQRVHEVKEMISELEDTRITLIAYGQEADDRLYAGFKAARDAMIQQLLSEHHMLDDLMAEAAEALVAANEDYISTLKVARETLGIEVYE